MMLNVETPAGDAVLAWERRAAEIITSNWPGCSYCKTPERRAAVIDAMLVKNGTIRCVAETKSRDCTLDKFVNQFNNEWLITFTKLTSGQQIASAMCVEYWGFLHLVPDDIVLPVRFWTPDARIKNAWLINFCVRKLTTSKGINGGTEERDNAFVDMAGASILRSAA